MVAESSRRVFAALGTARFVGGCVRDAVAGRPVADIDIATPLRPETVIARLEAAGIRAVPTGLAHGTVTALCDGTALEITTLRRDVACDGRHAEVAFTEDWLADAARRDLTINALSCTADGMLYDPFGGVADLAAGRVRFIGRAGDRIREDVLRLLRFFRFYGRYGRPPADDEALAACQALAPRLPGLSGERIRAELFRLLAHDRCAEVWDLMAEATVLPHLLPTAIRVDRLAALVRLETALGLGPADDRVVVRLAALLATDRAGAETVARRLRLSRDQHNRLIGLVAPAVAVDLAASPARLRRTLVTLESGERFRDLALLAAAATPDALESGPGALAPLLTMATQRAAVPFPVSGNDLLARGVPAGPAVGRWLADLEGWWAEQSFRPDREACLAELERRRA
jgi:poly(A) polymerase